MKKVITLAAIGLLCFAAGTVGIYLAMPSLAPDKVDTTRALLDSLGLISETMPDSVALPADSLLEDSTDTTGVAQLAPTPQDMIQELRDSIRTYAGIVQGLSADTTRLSRQLAVLNVRVTELSEKDFDATELSKSLAKLDAKQLGNILAGLELDTIELLYQKASGRERTRLIESMSPEQAARFVRTLVKGPIPKAELEGKEEDGAENAPEPTASRQ